MTSLSLRAPALAALLLAGLAACGTRPAPAPAPHVHLDPQALFTNGDFEGGTLTGWGVTSNLNYGIVVPPTSTASLQLQPGGATTFTKVVTGPSGSVIPAGLSSGASLRIPRYGSNAAVVNELGKNRNVNSMVQQMVTGNADVDPTDNKVHVRFAVAPVLENPSHADSEQPYFWIQLRNVTKGTVLFYTFNFSNQAGVPWKADPVTATTLYTDWQAFDIAPGPAQLAVGDTVEMLVIAAGCSLGGHYGHLYVDAFGPALPGLAVTATAPQSVNTGGTLTYTLTYKNAGPGVASSATIVENLPTGTTFASVSAPAGVICTTPAVGATGTVTCNAGTVAVMGTGTILVTVNVTAASGATLSNGNYSASATGASALVGPLVTTAVTSGVTYADLGVTLGDGRPAVGWGQAVSYTLTVANAGPGAASGATLTDALPAQLTGATWTCAAAGGAACPAASGSGSLAATLATLPSGGSVTYTINASVVAGSGSGTLVHQATVAAPAGVTDPSTGNNVAVDTDAIGTLFGLTVQKAGAGTGTVLSSPAAIACGTSCASQAASYVSGTGVVLTATAAAGQYFAGWGGACAAAGTASTCTVTVSAATTVTATFSPVVTVASSVTPAVHGQPVTFTATLPAAATGTVQFYVDGVALGGPVTVSSGAAISPSTSALSTGSHTIQAVYSGNSTYAGSTAGVTQVVGQAATTTALASSVNPSVFGRSVTFTATVAAASPGTGTPTGTVTFYDGATSLGTSTLNGAGVATFSTSALAVATHPVTAAYAASTDFAASTSAPVSEVVNAASTTTTLASSLDPSVLGQSVTFTATVAAVAPGAGTPAGTVTFFDGATSLGTGTLDASGAATLSTSALAAGTHSITAVYGASTSHAASTSLAVSQVVDRIPTTTAVTSSPNPSVTGQTITLTATVAAPGAGTPDGTVTFFDGATSLGTGTLDASGVATLSTSALAAGAHSITAVYGASTNYATSTSAAVSQQVNAASTTTAVAGSPNPSVVGQAVTLTATVAAVAPGAGTPGGTVTFFDGATSLGTSTLNGSGVATLTTSALAAGTHSITAVYGASTSYATSTSAAVGQQVDRAATTLALAPSPSPAVYGQAVTIAVTASAVAPGGGTPGGVVVILDGGVEIGRVTLDGSGHGALVLGALAAGSHAFTATFAGDPSFLPATTAESFTVGTSTTQVAVATSREPSYHGRPITFTATVTPQAGSAAAPDGTVIFKADGVVLGTGTLSGGVATWTDRTLVHKGTPYDVTAEYAGNANFQSGVATLTNGQRVLNSAPVAGAGTALAFGPGGPSQVVIPIGSAAPAIGDLTLEAWAKAEWDTAGQVSGSPSVVEARGVGLDVVPLAIAISADRSQVVWTVAGQARSVAAPMDDRAWHHLAVVSTATAAILYVDGLQADTAAVPRDAAATTLQLGRGLWGQVDEVRLWSVARAAAPLAADARRPLAGEPAGLIGHWHLDEGEGTELFDSSGGAHDGTVMLGNTQLNAFTPSQAWRLRQVGQDHDLAPAADAGYDPDGDPLTLTITGPALHGLASKDQAALQVGYHAGEGYLGTDSFTFQLDDGAATSSYQLALQVDRILTCHVTADCGGGDACLQSACVPADALDARSGKWGCSTSGGPSTALWAFLALGLLRRRPRHDRPLAR